jgi:hypothetical protein
MLETTQQANSPISDGFCVSISTKATTSILGILFHVKSQDYCVIVSQYHHKLY